MVGAPPVLRLYPKNRRRPGGVDLRSAERSPGGQSCPQRDGSPLYHKLLQVLPQGSETTEHQPPRAGEQERGVLAQLKPQSKSAKGFVGVYVAPFEVINSRRI